jgi:hypothetical protein
MEMSSGRPEAPTTELNGSDTRTREADPDHQHHARDVAPSPFGYGDTALSDPDRRPRNVDPLDPRRPGRENNDPLDPGDHVI